MCFICQRKQLGFYDHFRQNEERTKFEFDKESYSTEVRKAYEETKTYHDGKWLMFELKDTSLFPDVEKLLYIKRRPTPTLKESIDVVK